MDVNTKRQCLEKPAIFIRSFYEDEGSSWHLTKTWKLKTTWDPEWEQHPGYGSEFDFLRELIISGKVDVKYQADLEKEFGRTMAGLRKGGEPMILFKKSAENEIYMYVEEQLSGKDTPEELVFDHFMTNAFGAPVYDAVGHILSVLVWTYE
jgi:hypothetical protein